VLREVANLRLNPKVDGCVFPGGKASKPLSSTALLMLLRRMGRQDLTAHGLIPSLNDDHPLAQCLRPMDMMVHG
jgi:hypothetical protein